MTKNFLNESRKYKNSKGVFYHFDWNLIFQIADNQVMFRMHNRLEMCLIPTGLHKRGKLLYAVAVSNRRFYNQYGKRTVQRWKIIDYRHISDAFMTADELMTKYDIDIAQLPKGSRSMNDNWMAHKRAIDIFGNTNEFEKIICSQFERGLPKIVQSEHQKEKKNDPNSFIIASISRDEFVECVIKSLYYFMDWFVDGIELPCIAHIDSKKCMYVCMYPLVYTHLLYACVHVR